MTATFIGVGRSAHKPLVTQDLVDCQLPGVPLYFQMIAVLHVAPCLCGDFLDIFAGDVSY